MDPHTGIFCVSCSSTSSNSGSLRLTQAATGGPWLPRLWSGEPARWGWEELELWSRVPGFQGWCLPASHLPARVASPSTCRQGSPCVCAAEAVLASHGIPGPQLSRVMKTLPPQAMSELGTAGSSEVGGGQTDSAAQRGAMRGRLHVEEASGAEGGGPACGQRCWHAVPVHQEEESRGMNAPSPSRCAVRLCLLPAPGCGFQPRPHPGRGSPSPGRTSISPTLKLGLREGKRGPRSTQQAAGPTLCCEHHSRVLQVGLRAQRHPASTPTPAPPSLAKSADHKPHSHILTQ